jgi:hypothetical protein
MRFTQSDLIFNRSVVLQISTIPGCKLQRVSWLPRGHFRFFVLISRRWRHGVKSRATAGQGLHQFDQGVFLLHRSVLPIFPAIHRAFCAELAKAIRKPLNHIADQQQIVMAYGGTWKTFVGPPGSAEFSFTDDDILITEDQTDNLFRPVQETYNGARATYVSQNAGWVMKEAASRIFEDLQDEDGGLQLMADMQLPYVTNFNQAQRLMRAAVLDSRKQITHIMQMPPEAYILEPFDVVNWNSPRNGYVNKKFTVTSIEDLPNCNQLVALREINLNDYDWDVEYELPESVGPLKPVRPSQLALDFTVAADQIDSPSGKDRPAIAIDWDWNAPDIDVAFVKYEVRRDGTTKVIAHGTFHNTNDTTRTITSSALRVGKTYQVRLLAQPERAYRLSTWTGWKNVTCVIVDVPTAPTLTRVSDLADDGTLDFFVDVDWTAVTADVDEVYDVSAAIETSAASGVMKTSGVAGFVMDADGTHPPDQGQQYLADSLPAPSVVSAPQLAAALS